jgi:hypothetical protein
MPKHNKTKQNKNKIQINIDQKSEVSNVIGSRLGKLPIEAKETKNRFERKKGALTLYVHW